MHKNGYHIHLSLHYSTSKSYYIIFTIARSYPGVLPFALCFYTGSLKLKLFIENYFVFF